VDIADFTVISSSSTVDIVDFTVIWSSSTVDMADFTVISSSSTVDIDENRVIAGLLGVDIIYFPDKSLVSRRFGSIYRQHLIKIKMATNTIPTKIDGTFSMAESVKEGLETHQKTLGLKHNSAKDVQRDLDTARTRQQEYQAIRAEAVRVVTPALKAAESEVRTYIQRTRKALGDHLGEQWSVEWSEAGYLNNSVRMPSTVAEREALVKSLASYLEAHPEYEVPARGVTAKNLEVVHKALVDARQASREISAKQKTAGRVRDLALKALRKRLTGVLKELRMLLPGDSETWLAFGLNVPATRVSPAVKERAVAKAKEKAAQKAETKELEAQRKSLRTQLKNVGKTSRNNPASGAGTAAGESGVALSV
jgi:hypothetical protein